jgi:hypothetical protein
LIISGLLALVLVDMRSEWLLESSMRRLPISLGLQKLNDVLLDTWEGKEFFYTHNWFFISFVFCI